MWKKVRHKNESVLFALQSLNPIMYLLMKVSDRNKSVLFVLQCLNPITY